CFALGQKFLGVDGIAVFQIPDAVVTAQADAEALSGVDAHQLHQSIQGQSAGLDEVGVLSRFLPVHNHIFHRNCVHHLMKMKCCCNSEEAMAIGEVKVFSCCLSFL
ncbi:MAG: hypothetical protein IIV50_00120, partial [Muribaculaceae bacterium]|nr:hypothetical protein [Muribaculaceae bacterium]